MIITEQMKKTLGLGRFDWNIYFLPPVQLDRKAYKEVNEILTSLGGARSRKEKGHIFEGEEVELIDALQEVLDSGETTTLQEIKKLYQYYPTPSELAKKLVELADIKEWDMVLEPSAWQGAIAVEIPERLCCEIDVCELNQENASILIDKWFPPVHSDFLEYNAMYDKIIMNPPFSKNQDVKHILHAYECLNDWGRLVSIASSSIQTKETKLHKELMELDPEFIEVDDWAFKESWTMVNTFIVIINK